ncbi:MAG: hypothetical protein KF817_15740 [Phycisphaeraceae bacterium]|nr:hypothetical protein [Phycisphaeraceae bacterium]
MSRSGFRVRGGLRLTARDGVIAHSPLSGAWLALFEGALSEADRATAVDEARTGRVASLELAPGRAVAEVQTGPGRTTVVTIAQEAMPLPVRERMVESLADEALHLVRLLSGELPEALPSLLADLGTPLVPSSPQAIQVTYSGGGAGGRSPRTAYIVALLIAERMAEDATVALLLRGVAMTDLIEQVRQARLIRSRGRVAAHPEPALTQIQREPVPLAQCMDDFWRTGPSFSRLGERAPARHARLALLRRLGPSPFAGRFPFVGLLQSIYEAVASAQERGDDDAGAGGID